MPVRYGHFDDDRREYVITRPDTPLPWINYLGTEAFFGIISNTAGGYSYYRDARLRRITRYRYNNVPADTGGRYIYLRDNASGAYWSPSWQPTQRKLDSYECRHGLSYTQISASYMGIRAQTLYFVPIGETLEVWRLRIRNERDQPARLSVFSSVEFCLWNAQDDATNFQRNYSTGEVEVSGGVIYHTTEYRERRNHVAYFACSEPLAGFDTQREDFLGAYRGWDRPAAVERGESAGSSAHGWAPVGSHHVRLTLAPGETREVIFVLGYQENPAEAKFDPPGSGDSSKKVRQALSRWLRPATVADGFEQLRDSWTALLATLRVDTPDPDTNRMVNIWNPYQCLVTFLMSRSVSLFESGVDRGMGFRDSNQDLLGFVQLAPGPGPGPAARPGQHAAAHRRGVPPVPAADQAGQQRHRVRVRRRPAVAGAGRRRVPQGDRGRGHPRRAGALRQRAGQRHPAVRASGAGGAVHAGPARAALAAADRAGRLERLPQPELLFRHAGGVVPDHGQPGRRQRRVGVHRRAVHAGRAGTGRPRRAARPGRGTAGYRAAADKMAAAVVEHGWDGAWFRRAYDYFGNVVGSSENEEGQIFVEPQGICVLAGIGVENGIATRALDSVRERLATEHGIVLVHPAYRRYHVELGEISSYPPGYKENAGVFCHTNPWVMIAEAMIGRGDAAFDYYRRINPSAREDLSELHRCEPYVYAQMIAGKEAATPGEAKNSWLTGTAAWNLVAISQWILGIRAELGGLRIDPVLPAAWPGFTATRRFRGATYEISVRKQAGLTGRVGLVCVDGEPIEGTLVPPAAPGRTVIVEAIVR